MCASRDLNSALQATQNWISDLMWRLRWLDRERVYQALIVTLHALRDCLDRDDAIYMAAQLPALLRGFYCEGWHLGRPAMARNRNLFLDDRDPAVSPEEVVDRLPAAEVEGAKAGHSKRASEPLASIRALSGITV
ncbi:DUF2267 domain-containing protein [Mesorhizobium sp.]|uniref:DUF2267 domain-containing protein n=1 Tax=Mesorhizobium sp. TaxID=1871066 RepID=UPI00257C2CEC|nr:DUF2267 domain-containing protein [Mesorhizobium sp.]